MSSSPSQSAKPVTSAVRQRLQQLFEHGKKSFDKGDVDYAHEMFAKCVAEDPANLVYLQHLRANLSRKVAEGKKSMFGGQSRKTKAARSVLAKAVDQTDWEKAFAAGCEALLHGPGDVATLLDLASAAETIGATECHLYYLKWALDTDPKHEQANRRAAVALSAVGQFDQAIGCWKRVQEIKPDDHEVARAISHLSVEQTIHKGGYNQDVLRKGSNASAAPDEAATASLGQSNSAAADRDAADNENSDSSADQPDVADRREKELLEAIRLHPEVVHNYTDLADEYTRLDRLRDAERVLTKALTVVGGGNLELREQLEDTQLRRMRQQTMIADRRVQTEGTPETRELAQRMHSQANQIELEVYAARAQREPENAGHQFELGLRLKRAGKYREAIKSFQAARSDSRRLADTQLHLGECFQKIEQYRLAMSSYEAAIGEASDPNSDLHKLARYRAGVLATGMEEFEKAEKHLTELAAADFGYRDVADRLDKLATMRDT